MSHKPPSLIEPDERKVVSRPRPANRFVPSQIRILATPTPIVSYDPKRIGLLLLNTGVATIFIAATNAVDQVHSFPLPGGGALTLDSYIGELWGIVAAAPTILGTIDLGL